MQTALRILIVLLGTLALLAVAGAVYEAIGTWQNRRPCESAWLCRSLNCLSERQRFDCTVWHCWHAVFQVGAFTHHQPGETRSSELLLEGLKAKSGNGPREYSGPVSEEYR